MMRISSPSIAMTPVRFGKDIPHPEQQMIFDILGECTRQVMGKKHNEYFNQTHEAVGIGNRWTITIYVPEIAQRFRERMKKVRLEKFSVVING